MKNEARRPRIAVIGLSGMSVFMPTDHFHRPGETVHSTDLYTEPGGKGYNQVVAVNRLGGDAYFLSAVGEDFFGKECEDFLIREGVNLTLIKKQTKTAMAFILTNLAGENQVTVFRGATDELNTSDLNRFEEVIVRSDILLVQFEVPLPVIKKAIEIARANGIFIILNPAPAQAGNTDLLQTADVITPNELEANILLGIDCSLHIDLIVSKLKDNLIKSAIITLGDRGALLYDGTTGILIPPIAVNAVDTTGAGDVFNAAFAVRIGCKESLYEAAKYATVASGISVTKHYVMPSIPSCKEVAAYCKKSKYETDKNKPIIGF